MWYTWCEHQGDSVIISLQNRMIQKWLMQTKKSISLVLHNVDSAFDLKCITAQLFMFFGFNNSLAFSRGSHMLTYRKDLWREHSTDKWTEVDRPNQLYSTSVGWSIHPKKTESPLVMSMVSFLPYRVLPFSLAFSHGFYPWFTPNMVKNHQSPRLPKARHLDPKVA